MDAVLEMRIENLHRCNSPFSTSPFPQALAVALTVSNEDAAFRIRRVRELHGGQRHETRQRGTQHGRRTHPHRVRVGMDPIHDELIERPLERHVGHLALHQVQRRRRRLQ